MRCYAFRKESKEETLTEHVVGIATCLKEIWETEGLKQKLMKVYKVSKSLVNDLLLSAAILHDIGKAEEELQNTCKEECSSFKHHYVISALLALKLGYEVQELNLSPDNIETRIRRLLINRNLNYLDLGDAYLLIVVLPVLLHHYAQIVNEYSILDGLSTAKRYIKIHKDCVDELKTVINELRNTFESETGREILNKLENLITKETIEPAFINEKLIQDSCSYEYIPGRLVVEATTGILNLCDGRVAYKNRRP